MEQGVVTQQIMETAKQMALLLMKMQPAVRQLADAEAKNNCVKALHEITVQLEKVKKQMIQLEKGDSSQLL
jgi:hypothetical protein